MENRLTHIEKQIMGATAMLPIDYFVPHKGTSACASLSLFIFETFLKIKEKPTKDQIKKISELNQCYIDIVNDLSHVYRLEITIEKYQEKISQMTKEIESLKKEVSKLSQTLSF